MASTTRTIGFVGTGEIAEAIILGLRHGGNTQPIVVSPRSAGRSASLAAELADVAVATSNQAVLDESNIVVLSVLPPQVPDVVATLDWSSVDHLHSVVAGLAVADLSSLITDPPPVSRSIPMPPNRWGLGPIPLHPDDPTPRAMLEQIGTVIAVGDESMFDVFTGGSALMGTFFEFAAVSAGWMEKQGLDGDDAAAYVAGLFRSLATQASELNGVELAVQPESCLTPGGLNEQVLRGMTDAGFRDAVRAQLDAILARIRGS